MSPKQKSRATQRASKEQQKSSSKPSPAPTNGMASITGGACNPISGSFHPLEMTSTSSLPFISHNGGHSQVMEEMEEHCGVSLGTSADYDSVSNNSGELAEDQKEKPAAAPTNHRSDTIPGSDVDKREKIRQKNEKKHQRQRERRAQELHERCISYLTSRKLDALTQQLVAMGFPAERATMALILNDGRVEESVNWLLQGGEEGAEQASISIPDRRSNLKLNISEELARLADMELKFKCSKQDVERAVITCEGDLDKAVETLKAQKQEPPPKTGLAGDPPIANGKVLMASVANTPNPMAARTNPSKVVPASPVIIQQRRDEKGFNYIKGGIPGPATAPSLEATNANLQPLWGVPSKSEWVKPSAPVVMAQVEKRWLTPSSAPSVSYSSSSPVVLPSAKAEAMARNAALASRDIEGRPTVQRQQQQQVSEPVIMMQRPRALQSKQSPVSAAIATAGWHSNGLTGIDMLKVNGGGGDLGQLSPQQQFYQQSHYQLLAQSSRNAMGSSRVSPSSLGFFTGRISPGMSGSSSNVDWSTGSTMTQCDYNNIDWSMDLSSGSRSGGWPASATLSSYGARNLSRSPQTSDWPAAMMGGQTMRPGPALSPVDGASEWKPFDGNDLLRVSRQQFVTSPSL